MNKHTLRLTVELDARDLDELLFPRPKPKDLIGELMKIKSGEYENTFYGTIVKAVYV